MRINADTNILVRSIVGDDPAQSRVAEAELAGAESVVVTPSALCELAWVLSSGYRMPAREVARVFERLIAAETVVVDRPLVEAGLKSAVSGGDFADGVIAYQGAMQGADVFVSFDEKAVRLLGGQGKMARLAGSAGVASGSR